MPRLIFSSKAFWRKRSRARFLVCYLNFFPAGETTDGGGQGQWIFLVGVVVGILGCKVGARDDVGRVEEEEDGRGRRRRKGWEEKRREEKKGMDGIGGDFF